MLKRGTTLFHPRLVEQARPDHPAWAEATRQVTRLVMRGRSDATLGQQKALAVLDRVITGQAAVLLIRARLRSLPCSSLPRCSRCHFFRKERPAAGVAASIDL